MEVGFLEESPGVRSMSRLAIAVLLGFTAIVVGLLAWYVLTQTISAAILGAFATVLGALVAGGAVAIANRHAPDEKV